MAACVNVVTGARRIVVKVFSSLTTRRRYR